MEISGLRMATMLLPLPQTIYELSLAKTKFSLSEAVAVRGCENEDQF